MRRKLTMAEIGRLDRAAFVAAFAAVFEHAPWVAEEAWRARPFDSAEALHGAMVAALRSASREQQLALIRAHPDLAGKAAVAGDMTADSRREQAGAGLDRLSQSEYDRFQELNAAYKARFGFPFILAVKGRGKAEILAAFEARLENGPEAELERALEEIARIAAFRLEELIEAE